METNFILSRTVPFIHLKGYQNFSSGCACTETELTASMFPDLSFQVLSFSCVLGALIASWDEIRLLFNEISCCCGDQSRNDTQFRQCSSYSVPLGSGALAATLNLSNVF